MTDPNFIFRSGKHKDKSYLWVEENDPSYITWILENRPEMLGKKTKPKVVVTKLEDYKSVLQPNQNFLNEGPDPLSVPYLKKIAEAKSIKSFFDLDL